MVPRSSQSWKGWKSSVLFLPEGWALIHRTSQTPLMAEILINHLNSGACVVLCEDWTISAKKRCEAADAPSPSPVFLAL